MNYLKSIAKLCINNHFAGTAWLVNSQFVITAAHCVGKHTRNFTVIFYQEQQPVHATLIEKDEHLDIALLKLDIPRLTLERLEISKTQAVSNSDNWIAHGYPDVINDRFKAGITIGGKIRNPNIQFDHSPAIQLLCEEGVNEFDFDAPHLRGISGAPVLNKADNRVIGIIRYAPPEFAEKVIIATPIDIAVKKLQRHLPEDLHIFNTSDVFEFEYFDDQELLGSSDVKEKPQKLKDFQKNIYKTFDNLGIVSFHQYQSLNEQERLEINKEILGKMIGLGGSHDELLELNHVNTRFPDNLLRKTINPENQDPWDVMHRKSAIYSDHSLICIKPVRHYADVHAVAEDKTISDKTINHLLQHRSLIELGKMSVVPEIVKVVDRDYREKTVFNVGKLDTIKVDLKDPVIRSFFFKKGKMLKRQGTIVLKSPHSEGLPLDEIMEIIEGQYPEMYGIFQSHLKGMMGQISPDDDTHSLKYGLRAVDTAIQELDEKYKYARRKLDKITVDTAGSGALAVGLYSAEPDVMTFTAAAFSDSPLSSLISFIPDSEPIPKEVRLSPFFIPWLIHHHS